MGKPNAVKTALRCHEFNSGIETTQGTETSQYLVENKSKEIALVVASERATA